MQKRTFLELTITQSSLANVPVPRRILVDSGSVSSVEDLGANPHARCYITLSEANDATVESDSGEQVVRGTKGLMTLDTYDEICQKLSAVANIVPSRHASELEPDAAPGRVA